VRLLSQNQADADGQRTYGASLRIVFKQHRRRSTPMPGSPQGLWSPDQGKF
jgi:hypothetical protein